MSRRRIILLFVAAFVIVGGSYIISLVNNRAQGSPTLALASIDVEDVVPVSYTKTTDQLIEFWRGRFEQDPNDFLSLMFLGQAFMRKGRETGDASMYEKAETAFRKSLEIDPGYEVAIAYLSAALFTKHDFQGALDLANRVYASDPSALQVLATIGDSQLELGNYAEAESAFQHLVDKVPSAPVYGRLSRLAWLKGNPSEALKLMQQAVDDASTSGLTGEPAAWYQFQLGELYFNTGRADEAVKNYSAALNTYDNYYLALAGLGKAYAAQGRYDDAIELYKRAVAIIPQPDFLAALGDLYTITGKPDDAKRQYDTVEFIGKLAAINKVIYNRQLALFYANHDQKLDEALDFASKEAVVRKDVYGYDALAWALYKNGRYSEAAQAIDQAMRLGTQDALIYYHAGMIQDGLGHPDQAQTLLGQALYLNPNFDLLQTRLAQAKLDQLRAQ